MVYNEEDPEVKKVVEDTTNQIKRYAYKTPDYRIENGATILETSEGDVPLEIFGKHNLQNLEGARSICFHLGLSEESFYEAIADFSGASKRLEKIAENEETVIFKDFAHSPSKVEATTRAVREQYADRKLLACLELHTYSSLNEDFLKEYLGTLEQADEAVVFYSPNAVKIKRLKEVSEAQIAKAFQRKDLLIYTEPEAFRDFLFTKNLENTAVLLMSSGNYGGLDFDDVKELV